MVIEQGHWDSRRTAWKPHGDNVRNLRTLHAVQPDIEGGRGYSRGGANMQPSRAHEVLEKHTYFEYEEFVWHKYRSFSARGDGTADVRWPEYTLEPDQRISERRETYHARFSPKTGAGAHGGAQAGTDDGADEYVTELDEATWRRLRVGRRCRLTMGAFSDEVKQVTPLP